MLLNGIIGIPFVSGGYLIKSSIAKSCAVNLISGSASGAAFLATPASNFPHNSLK